MYLKVMLTLLVILEAAAAALLWRAGWPEPGAGYYNDEEVAAGMNRPVRDVTLNNVEVSEVIARIEREAGVKINVDWDALNEYDVYDRYVSVQWRSTNVDAALRSIGAGRYGSHVVEVCAEAGAVCLTTSLPQTPATAIRVYDVRDLHATLVEPLDPVTAGWYGGMVSEIVIGMIHLNLQDRSGATTRYLSSEAGGVWVLAALPAVHRRVEAVLHMLRAAVDDRADAPPTGGR